MFENGAVKRTGKRSINTKRNHTPNVSESGPVENVKAGTLGLVKAQ